MTKTTAPSRRTPWPILAVAVFCIVLAVPLIAGGVWLIALGGSWYYALAGLGLLITGFLLFRGSETALWVYLATWLGTLIWAWWEVGADWWAQLPRMLAPTLILLFVLLSAQFLKSHDA
ncbi:glucose dehydrogenase [Paracoccus sp. TK19116]|uniref:Glucose dehydrogenase n=1 Tax=Paracoccus albicereus TaxID=2922394 RepID=A0ABT1MQ83_9RHOB|nr:glucose dehydrogenase [Paracoccus albicereus]MCQ0970475.1 glucose dehydrogenase [Paracoccus albicereus]